MLALTKKLSFWHYLTEFTLASQSELFGFLSGFHFSIWILAPEIVTFNSPHYIFASVASIF